MAKKKEQEVAGSSRVTRSCSRGRTLDRQLVHDSKQPQTDNLPYNPVNEESTTAEQVTGGDGLEEEVVMVPPPETREPSIRRSVEDLRAMVGEGSAVEKDAEERALERELAALERKKRLRKRIAVLQAKRQRGAAREHDIYQGHSPPFTISIPSAPTESSSLLHSDEKESSDENENVTSERRSEGKERQLKDLSIRIKLPIFGNGSTFQDRGHWIKQLELMFEAQPRAFESERQRVIVAYFHMDTTLKRQWDQYVSNLDDDDERKRVEGSWEKFKDWTTTLAPTVRDTSLQAHEAYRRARQRPYQSPTEFLSYLRSLEYQIGYLPEQFRKHIFFLGLHKSVKTLLSAAIDYKAIRFRDLIERAESLHLQMATTKPQTQKIRKRGSREPMGRQRQDNKKRRVLPEKDKSRDRPKNKDRWTPSPGAPHRLG